MCIETSAISDLGVASFLLTKGHALLYLNRSNPQRVGFVFTNTSALERDIDTYWERTARVDPQTLFLNQKALKARLYSTDSR